MNLPCPNCRNKYGLIPTDGTDFLKVDSVLRCGHCNNTIKIKRGGSFVILYKGKTLDEKKSNYIPESIYMDKNVAKWVRPNHVQTDEHWMWKDVVPNKLSLE